MATNVTPISKPAPAITLLSAAHYTNTSGKLIKAEAGAVVIDCIPGDLKDLREAGIVVELTEDEQYAVEVLRGLPEDKKALIRTALGV